MFNNMESFYNRFFYLTFFDHVFIVFVVIALLFFFVNSFVFSKHAKKGRRLYNYSKMNVGYEDRLMYEEVLYIIALTVILTSIFFSCVLYAYEYDSYVSIANKLFPGLCKFFRQLHLSLDVFFYVYLLPAYRECCNFLIPGFSFLCSAIYEDYLFVFCDFFSDTFPFTYFIVNCIYMFFRHLFISICDEGMSIYNTSNSSMTIIIEIFFSKEFIKFLHNFEIFVILILFHFITSLFFLSITLCFYYSEPKETYYRELSYSSDLDYDSEYNSSYRSKYSRKHLYPQNQKPKIRYSRSYNKDSKNLCVPTKYVRRDKFSKLKKLT